MEKPTKMEATKEAVEEAAANIIRLHLSEEVDNLVKEFLFTMDRRKERQREEWLRHQRQVERTKLLEWDEKEGIPVSPTKGVPLSLAESTQRGPRCPLAPPPRPIPLSWEKTDAASQTTGEPPATVDAASQTTSKPPTTCDASSQTSSEPPAPPAAEATEAATQTNESMVATKKLYAAKPKDAVEAKWRAIEGQLRAARAAAREAEEIEAAAIQAYDDFRKEPGAGQYAVSWSKAVNHRKDIREAARIYREEVMQRKAAEEAAEKAAAKEAVEKAAKAEKAKKELEEIQRRRRQEEWMLRYSEVCLRELQRKEVEMATMKNSWNHGNSPNSWKIPFFTDPKNNYHENIKISQVGYHT